MADNTLKVTVENKDVLGVTVQDSLIKASISRETVNVNLDKVVTISYGGEGSDDNKITKVYTAGTNIGIHKAVALNASGKLIISDSSNFDTLNRTLGISLQSVTAGTACEVLLFGEVSDPSFNFSNDNVFVGVGGTLVTTPPSSGYVLNLGIVVNPTTLYINKQMPIKLS